MSIARAFKSAESADLIFPRQVLLELSHADDPQEALAEAVNRAKDETAYSVIRLGQRLVELKDDCKHGEFTRIAEECCGLKERQCQNLMRIYHEFGENRTAVRFSTIALLELSRADDPQDALAEAEKMEGTLTAKQAKEIAELQRQVAAERERIAASEPDLNKLTPELVSGLFLFRGRRFFRYSVTEKRRLS